MKPSKPLRSDIAWSNATSIGIHGHDLCNDLLGKVNFGDMAFLEVTGRLPKAPESRVFNALLVTLVEHGIVPSTLAARMTYAGAPEAMQAAVAAGLLGLGSVFVGSTEGAARMLEAALAPGANGSGSGSSGEEAELGKLADGIVQAHAEARHIVPGLGHPVHKPVDPRAVRLFQIAAEEGLSGRYVALMEEISRRASDRARKILPVNATGAIGALCCELGLTWQAARGFGVMARAVGLVGHLLEEARQPMAVEIWQRAEHEASEHIRGTFRKPDGHPQAGTAAGGEAA
jgi:citrate synthase